MIVQFYKFEGTGNDFIMIDGRGADYSILTQAVIERLCNRHFGIGADGLIVLDTTPNAHFRMVYFNSDGRQSSMCGNGGRCITAFASYLGIIRGIASFEAIDGLHDAIINSAEGNHWDISLKMINVSGFEEIGEDYYLNTGSPHYVRFVNNTDSVDVVTEGRAVRYNERFMAEGTNVNFVSQRDNSIDVRTYERGVENETLSCGTGVTAAAIAAYIKGIPAEDNSYTIQTTGGSLRVRFNHTNGHFSDVWLSGPVRMVFEGQIEI